jgi:hypothetical protein
MSKHRQLNFEIMIQVNETSLSSVILPECSAQLCIRLCSTSILKKICVGAL